MNLQDRLISAGINPDASKEASGIAATLATFLSKVPSGLKPAAVECILAECFRQAKNEPIDPEVVEWARNNFDLEQAASNLQEIRETGGCRLADFDAELERIASGQT